MEFFGSLGAVSILVLLTLLVFSVVSWAIIIYKWRVFRLADLEEAQFLDTYARIKDTAELRRQAGQLTTSPSAAVFRTVLDRQDPDQAGLPAAQFQGDPPDEYSAENGVGGHGYLQRVVEYIMQGQVSKQEAYLPFLATTGNVTPFIGLLGTVLGIINAFTEIGQTGTASIAAVAPGIAEALVATAAGLFTAIPAVIAYNYYLTRVRKSAFRLEAFSIEFVNQLQARQKTVGVRG